MRSQVALITALQRIAPADVAPAYNNELLTLSRFYVMHRQLGQLHAMQIADAWITQFCYEMLSDEANNQ